MDKNQEGEENPPNASAKQSQSIRDATMMLNLLMNGFRFKDNEFENSFHEEIRRCNLPPLKERTLLLVGHTEFIHSNDGPQEMQEITVLNRMFDMTVSSEQRRAFYDVEEIRKIEKLGYDLNRAILVHPHPIGFNPSPSLCDIASFLTTDLALKKSLNYAVISFQDQKPMVLIFNFKKCLSCPQSFGNLLKNAPIFDSTEVKA